MELILWRHAEAENSHPDMDRALTFHGQKQAHEMAAWLKPRLPAKTRILASPAKRTQQTAEALGLDFITLDTLSPGTSALTLLTAAGWPDASDPVLIVGHQPTLGMAAAYAMTGRNQYWGVKKGAVLWLAHRMESGESSTLLRAVLTPDLLQAK